MSIFSTGQQFFNRSWSVTIGTTVQSGQAGVAASAASQSIGISGGGLGTNYTSLKTTFDIMKTSVSSSNKAKIELWNLSDASRQAFQKKGLLIQLQAGYVGLLETLYLGNIVNGYSERKGADIVTTFECGDSEKQLVNAHFEQSYPPGTTYTQVITDIVSSLSGLGINTALISGLPNLVYNSGVTFSDSIKHILDKMLKRTGLEWSIQNGYLQILPITSYDLDDAIVVSPSTGLIGIPTLKASGIQFTSLLNPKLLPGRSVIVNSQATLGTPQFLTAPTPSAPSTDAKLIKGLFKVRTAHFEGDSHGTKWGVTCEGVTIAATPVSGG